MALKWRKDYTHNAVESCRTVYGLFLIRKDVQNRFVIRLRENADVLPRTFMTIEEARKEAVHIVTFLARQKVLAKV